MSQVPAPITGPHATPDITIHHLKDSRSERIFWALEELGIPYNVKVYFRVGFGQAPPELRQVHPLGKSPIITDHGRPVAESGAILEYLINTYPKSGTPSPPPYSFNDSYWSHFAEGSLMIFLQEVATFHGTAKGAPWLARGVIDKFVAGVQEKYLDVEIQKMVDYMDSELSKSGQPYFSGAEPYLADYMLCYPVHSLLSRPTMGGVKVPEGLRAYFKAIEARPAYQRGMKRLADEEAKAKSANNDA